MADKSIIIIGAGLAGLSAGCYAQMNGYRSRIFEHHSKPGGVVASWRRKDYLIDGGIHFLMGHRPGQSTHELYRELGIISGCKLLDLEVYGAYTDLKSGKSIIMSTDLNRFFSELKTMSPADARHLDALMADVQVMAGMDFFGAGLDTPFEIMGLAEMARAMWRMRSMFKYFYGRHNAPVSEYVKRYSDPFVRDVLLNLFMPEVPLWFIYSILALLADRQLGVIAGGSREFVGSIVKRYQDLGGEIGFRSDVEEILVEKDAAVGVKLRDGSEHRADVVISAGDGYSTIYKLLRGKYVDRKIAGRYRSWPLFRPLLMINYGVAREFPGEPYNRTLKLKEPLLVARKKVECLFIRIFNYSDKFAPAGKTVVQAELETEWDYWNGLQERDRPAYDAEKKRMAEEVLKRLDDLFPGIRGQVELTDVATPYTFWRYTLNHQGAFEGFLITPEIIQARVKKTLPGLKNFYMAGQWVMPGGGVPPCLYSGRHVVQMLCQKERKPFQAGQA